MLAAPKIYLRLHPLGVYSQCLSNVSTMFQYKIISFEDFSKRLTFSYGAKTTFDLRSYRKNTLELSQVFHLAKCDLKSYYT